MKVDGVYQVMTNLSQMDSRFSIEFAFLARKLVKKWAMMIRTCGDKEKVESSLFDQKYLNNLSLKVRFRDYQLAEEQKLSFFDQKFTLCANIQKSLWIT